MSRQIETLIDALYLANMTHTEIRIKQDKYVGIKDYSRQNVCVSIRSAGTGGDNAPQVIELPMVQVAEYNKSLKDK